MFNVKGIVAQEAQRVLGHTYSWLNRTHVFPGLLQGYFHLHSHYVCADENANIAATRSS